MRSLLYCLISICSVAAFAERPGFSAFVDSDQLHITIMADQCNAYGGDLMVDSFCDKNRNTRNIAPVCKVDLRVVQTRAMCHGPLKPKVITLDLRETQVDTSRLQVIELSYGGYTVAVPYD